MNQNDYYIVFDENGTPYIEHGFFDNVKNTVKNVANKVTSTASNAAKGVGRGVRANHKYLLKVFENGKTRYFYKQSEVDAYYRAKKVGIKNAAEYVQNKAKDAETSAKDMINKAKETVKSTVREATGYAAKDRMNAAAAKRSELNDTQNQKHEVWTQAKKAKDQADIKTFLATAESEMANEKAKNSNIFNRKQRETDAKTASDQQKQYAAKSREAGANEQKAKRELDEAIDAYNKNAGEEYDNQRMYEKSLAGAVDRTVSSAKDMVDKAKSAVKDTASKASNAAKNMVDTARKNVQSEVDARQIDKLTTTADNAYDDLQYARKKANDARRKADETHDPNDIKEYEQRDRSARLSSQIYKEAQKEVERAKESASNGTLTRLDSAEKAYKADKASADYASRVKDADIAQKQFSDYYRGLKTKHGFNENTFSFDEPLSEQERSNLNTLEEKLQKANAAAYATEWAYNDALYDYKNSPLGKVESKKKNK
jgi:hypothetical protein